MQQSFKTSPYLFVYGSLRMGFHNEAYKYISDYFQFVGNAKTKGYLYDAGTYPVAKPVLDEHFIIGELYMIKDPQLFDWAIAQIDDYEGVNIEQGETELYHRTICEVLYNNEIFLAHIYWYNGDISNLPLLPMKDVVEYFRNKQQ